MALHLEEQTLPEFLQRLKEEWEASEGPRAALIARFIVTRLATGEIDKADYKRAFGLNEPQWQALLRRLNDLLEAYAVVEDAKGGF